MSAAGENAAFGHDPTRKVLLIGAKAHIEHSRPSVPRTKAIRSGQTLPAMFGLSTQVVRTLAPKVALAIV